VILGYFSDILYTDGSRAEKYLTVDERNDLIGDGRIASASYIPLAASVSRTMAIAWLVEKVTPGPYITSNWRSAEGALLTGAQVTGLRLANGTQHFSQT
jgi:hypothetical protein